MASATDLIISLMKKGGNRLLKLYFPHDDGPSAGLLVNELHAFEPVSADFIYTVTALSDDTTIELKDMMAKMVCVELLRAKGNSRYFNGYCHAFALQRIVNGAAVYQMVLKPWLRFFDLRKDYHIFHEQSIEQQTKEMFLEIGITVADLRIQEPDPVQTFCVQYDETDYNYLHRQWERMGWHYYYEHTLNSHKLILSSTSTACEPIDGDPEIAWHHDGGANKLDKIGRFSPVRQVVSGKVALSNYDFKSPTPQRLSETSEMDQGDASFKVEVYEYEGLYGYKNEADGRNIARRRMEQIECQGKLFHAEGDHRGVQPGRWFRLTKDYVGQSLEGGAADNEFFVISATHKAHNNFLSSEGEHAAYTNELTCLRRAIPWRPEQGLNSQPTTVPGIDTATVVGPKGEEIHTDKYGRIKVHFHWDRRGKNDTNSSCWLRVMTPWADSNFGMISLPRVGTEVVIQFLQGNPDRPLVIGQLYNQTHMPPWDLPNHKTQSGVLSRSSKGGTAANANAFRFEDEKGNEEIWMHAEKNQRIEVENDESHWVGHDRKKTIDHDETTLVKHDRTETVDNDETITVHNNRKERVDHNEDIDIGDNRTEKVGKNEDISIGDNRNEKVGKNEDVNIGANRSVTVGKNKSETVAMAKMETIGMAKILTIGGLYQTTVGAAMNTTVAMAQGEEVGLDKTVMVGQKFHIKAGDELEIEVGESRFLMRKDGRIELIGKEILISGAKKVEAHGDDIDLNPG